MTDPVVVTLIIGFIAQAGVVLGAWIKTQRDITEVKTDIRWLKRYAQHRRESNHGTESA